LGTILCDNNKIFELHNDLSLTGEQEGKLIMLIVHGKVFKLLEALDDEGKEGIIKEVDDEDHDDDSQRLIYPYPFCQYSWSFYSMNDGGFCHDY
jgi:hypothetical protein